MFPKKKAKIRETSSHAHFNCTKRVSMTRTIAYSRRRRRRRRRQRLWIKEKQSPSFFIFLSFIFSASSSFVYLFSLFASAETKVGLRSATTTTAKTTTAASFPGARSFTNFSMTPTVKPRGETRIVNGVPSMTSPRNRIINAVNRCTKHPRFRLSLPFLDPIQTRLAMQFAISDAEGRLCLLDTC